MEYKTMHWEDVISADKIDGVYGGVTRQEVNDLVLHLTSYEYFLFNGSVFRVRHGYSEDTGWRLNYETRELYKEVK